MVFDCPEPAALATFYGDLLGGAVDWRSHAFCFGEDC
jgi:hypothetical protein